MTLTDRLNIQTIKPSKGIVESLIIPAAKKTWDLGIILLGAYSGATQHENPAMGAVIGAAIGFVVGPMSRYVFFQKHDYEDFLSWQKEIVKNKHYWPPC